VVVGRLAAVDEEGIRLETDGETQSIPYHEIAQAKLELEW